MTENDNAPESNNKGGSTATQSESIPRSDFFDNGESATPNPNNDKVLSNHDQMNDDQTNNDQLNQVTNEADLSARFTDNGNDVPSTEFDSDRLGIVPEENLDYHVENPTLIGMFPKIRPDQFDPKLYYELKPDFENEEVMMACALFSYIVWKNINFFNYPQANTWRMNKKDYLRLHEFCTEQIVVHFNHLLFIADSIFEKAFKANDGPKFVSVAYLTSQIGKDIDVE